MMFLKETYERKLGDKERLLTKYTEVLSQLETEHASCVETQTKQANNIKSLEAYVEKETIRVLEMSM